MTLDPDDHRVTLPSASRILALLDSPMSEDEIHAVLDCGMVGLRRQLARLREDGKIRRVDREHGWRSWEATT